MKIKGSHEQQLVVLAFIMGYKYACNEWPSNEAIATALRWSIQRVNSRLQELIAAGDIVRATKNAHLNLKRRPYMKRVEYSEGTKPGYEYYEVRN